MSYVVIWEFQVRQGAETEFERVYGPTGDWVQLFQRAEGYLRSALLRNREVWGCYLVLDYWESAARYEDFRSAHEADYSALDQRCESLTLRETRIGNFTDLP